MANDQSLSLLNQQFPAYLQQKSPEDLVRFNQEAAAGTLGNAVNRISLKQSRFRLIKNGSEVAVLQNSFLDVVILRASTVLSKTFYEKQYNPGQEPEAPDCYSEDGVRPAADSKKKQHANCAECPQNQWGSKKNPLTQADIKACADSKRVSIVPHNQLGSEPFQLAIPAASMRDFGAYMNKLSTVSAPYNAVVTRVAFDTEASYPKLLFTAVRYLTKDEYDVVNARFEEEDVKRTAGIPGVGYSANAQAAAEKAGHKKEDLIPASESTDDGSWGGDTPEPKKEAAPEKPKATRSRAKKPEPEPSHEPAGEVDGWGASADPAPQSNKKPEPEVAEVDNLDDVDAILQDWDLG